MENRGLDPSVQLYLGYSNQILMWVLKGSYLVIVIASILTIKSISESWPNLILTILYLLILLMISMAYHLGSAISSALYVFCDVIASGFFAWISPKGGWFWVAVGVRIVESCTNLFPIPWSPWALNLQDKCPDRLVECDRTFRRRANEHIPSMALKIVCLSVSNIVGGAALLVHRQ